MEENKNYIRPKILVEEWKVYKTICHGKRVYEVSNLGRVKVNGVITEPHTRTGGYKGIGRFLIHRAVAELFIPNPENKPFIDHIDTNPSNNMVWNLRWVTQKENCNNPLTRQHNSESLKVAQNRSDVRQKKSKSMKDFWSNPDHRQKQSEILKEVCNTPEIKKKKSETSTVVQNHPEVKQKQREAQKDRHWINKNNIRKKVKTDQLSLFLNKGWKLGRK